MADMTDVADMGEPLATVAGHWYKAVLASFECLDRFEVGRQGRKPKRQPAIVRTAYQRTKGNVQGKNWIDSCTVVGR